VRRLFRFYPAACLVVLAFAAFALSSCGKSDSGSGTSDGGKQASGMERAAEDAALAEVKKHWSKAADGWITARNSGTSFAPVRFVREMRDLTVEGVRSADLSEADKMNGLEWSGEVSFKQSPCREAGDQGILLDGLANVTVFRQRGQWTQWVDFQPERVQVQKAKGNWQIQQDTWLLRGSIPGAEDFSNAGVK
jgi:hypothetical protein